MDFSTMECLHWPDKCMHIIIWTVVSVPASVIVCFNNTIIIYICIAQTSIWIYSVALYPNMRIYTQRPDHDTGNYIPYSLRTVSGFFNVPQSYLRTRVVRRGLRFIDLIREDKKV